MLDQLDLTQATTGDDDEEASQDFGRLLRYAIPLTPPEI